MFCCSVMDNLVKNAGERGFAVVVTGSSDAIRFTLQSRALAFNDMAKMKATHSPTFPKHVTLASGVVIQYCPSCGKRLGDLVDENPAYFRHLAYEHSCYQDKIGSILFAQ